LEYWRNERKVYNREFRSESQGFPFAAHSYIVLKCILQVLHDTFSIVPWCRKVAHVRCCEPAYDASCALYRLCLSILMLQCQHQSNAMKADGCDCLITVFPGFGKLLHRCCRNIIATDVGFVTENVSHYVVMCKIWQSLTG